MQKEDGFTRRREGAKESRPALYPRFFEYDAESASARFLRAFAPSREKLACGVGRQLQGMQLLMSTFAVEKTCRLRQLHCGSEAALVYEEVEMRIVETAAVGVIALASQFLVIAAVLI